MASCRHNPLTSAAVTTAMLLVLALTASCSPDWSFADADGTVSVGGDSLTLTLIRDTLIEGHDVAVCDSSQMHGSRHSGEAALTGEAANGMHCSLLLTMTLLDSAGVRVSDAAVVIPASTDRQFQIRLDMDNEEALRCRSLAFSAATSMKKDTTNTCSLTVRLLLPGGIRTDRLKTETR